MSIVFTTVCKRCAISGRVEDVADRASAFATGRPVRLPRMSPAELGARWDDNLGLWRIEDRTGALDARYRSAWRRVV